MAMYENPKDYMEAAVDEELRDAFEQHIKEDFLEDENVFEFGTMKSGSLSVAYEDVRRNASPFGLPSGSLF